MGKCDRGWLEAAGKTENRSATARWPCLLQRCFPVGKERLSPGPAEAESGLLVRPLEGSRNAPDGGKNALRVMSAGEQAAVTPSRDLTGVFGVRDGYCTLRQREKGRWEPTSPGRRLRQRTNPRARQECEEDPLDGIACWRHGRGPAASEGSQGRAQQRSTRGLRPDLDSLRPVAGESEPGASLGMAIRIPGTTANTGSAQGRDQEVSPEQKHGESAPRGGGRAGRHREIGQLCLPEAKLRSPPRGDRMGAQAGPGASRLQEYQDSDRLRPYTGAGWQLDDESLGPALSELTSAASALFVAIRTFAGPDDLSWTAEEFEVLIHSILCELSHRTSKL